MKTTIITGFPDRLESLAKFHPSEFTVQRIKGDKLVIFRVEATSNNGKAIIEGFLGHPVEWKNS